MANPNTPSIAKSFQPGDKLAGCYTLKEIIPGPGVSVVWLAHDEELGKDIALHFVPDSVASDTRAMAELKQETKRNRQLIHPRIVRVHDLVEDEKWSAISMDHIKGDSLSTLQLQHEKKAFNPSEIFAAVSELCQTVEDAHRIDLFHRDLTPDNLIATANGLMVQKFGISRVILDALARSGHPVEGGRDLAYISPQQLDGERPNRLDDIYSIGASLFDLLTGAAPFADGDPVPQIRKTVPPMVSERRAAKQITAEAVPKPWDDAIAACLAKNPEERPKSAAETGARFASGKPSGAQSGPAYNLTAAAPAAAVAAATVASAAPAAGSETAAPSSAKVEPPPEATPAPVPPVAAPPAETPQPVATVEEPASRGQKRQRPPGPGKAPVIAEATVLSKTPVTKGEAGREPEDAGAGGGVKKPATPGATTPSGFPLQAFVGVDATQPPKPKSHGGIIALIVGLLLIVLVAYNLASKKTPAPSSPEAAVASTGSNAASPAPEESSSPAAEQSASPTAEQPASAGASPVNVAANAVPIPTSEGTPLPNEAAPAPSASIPAPDVAALAALRPDQAAQLLSDKAKAVNQAKAAMAAADQAAKDKAAAQAQAAADAQAMQAAIKDKAAADAAAKSAADAAAAALKQQQEALARAEADASAAQKAADDKINAATQARKAVQDAQLAAQQQQTAQQQADAAAADATKAAADRQKAADAAAQAAADAEKARAAQAQAFAQAQADLNQTQAALQQARQSQAAEKAREEAAAAAKAEQQRQAQAAAQAAADAARIQQQRDADAARLAAQAAAAAKAADDAKKALEAAQIAVANAEKAQHEAEVQAEAARAGVSPAPAASATPAPVSSPAAEAPLPVTPAASAAPMPSAVPVASPVGSATPPNVSVQPPSPNSKVDQALVNSLGMRFSPVGNILFSIWLTRVQDFQAFATATGFQNEEWLQPGFKQAPDHPVVNVSWSDANAFCLWLTEKEHHQGILAVNETYRLPTDLEWSQAVGLPAESGRTPEARDMDVPDVYPWGTQWPPPAGAGNYTGEETDSDVAIKGYNDGFAWTSPVGSFNPNKYGLYDMGGNVWQWCADWWNSEQKQKVLRGGSWYNGALKLSLLSSCRIHYSADQSTDNYGFRVVVAPETTKEKTPKHHAQ